jgi:hypothetical protein
MKNIFLLLAMANILLFAALRWGGVLTVEENPTATVEINADKIKLLAHAPLPVSAPIFVPVMSSVVVVSAPVPVLPSPPTIPNLEENKAVVTTCLEWGEFSGTDLARSQQVLAELKLGEHLGQRTVEYTSGYWVYIPPQKSRKGVKKKVDQLKERGVTDYFVVQEEGVWMNAISLGVFKTEEAAQKYLISLKEKNVHTAKVGQRISRLKFIVYSLKLLDVVTGKKIVELQKDFPGSTLKTVACN